MPQNMPFKIVNLPFPDEKYFKQEFPKKQIVLHHTASGKGTNGDYRTFLNNKFRIATQYIIDVDGTVNQLFATSYWGHHLGITADFMKAKGFADSGVRNALLNKQSIAIEIDAWGGVAVKDGKYYSYTGTEIPEAEVIKYDTAFKTYGTGGKATPNFFDKAGVANKPCFHYHRYTPAQIAAVKQLLIYLCNTYKIPNDYNADIWDVTLRALRGESGIFCHVSYRNDKSDPSPQPELIAMLKSLKSGL